MFLSYRINFYSKTLNRHSKTLNRHSKTLNRRSKTLNRHSKTLNRHSKTLNRHSKTLNEEFSLVHKQFISGEKITSCYIRKKTAIATTEKYSHCCFFYIVTIFYHYCTILKRIRNEWACSSQFVPSNTNLPICAVERTCLPIHGQTS